MPVVGNDTIENLTAIQALNRGYLTIAEYKSHIDWVSGNLEERHRKTFIYIN